jgi:hypothetical protein
MMGSRGMDRDTFRLEVARMVADVRSDIRTAITRVDGFIYTVRVDARIRYKKAKRAAKQVWQELWR